MVTEIVLFLFTLVVGFLSGAICGGRIVRSRDASSGAVGSRSSDSSTAAERGLDEADATVERIKERNRTTAECLEQMEDLLSRIRRGSSNGSDNNTSKKVEDD